MTNVLLICIDALRADYLGCYGRPDNLTPHIDALARHGVTFRNAISQASWTRPSVASLFTSLYPSQHGLTELTKGTALAAALDPAVPTLAELFAAGGDRTAAFAAQNANLRPLFGLPRGFAEFHMLPTKDGAVVIDEFDRWVASGPEVPWFCYVHLMDVHYTHSTAIITSRLDRGLDLQLVNESVEELLNHYARAVNRADDYVGRTVDTLHDTRLYDDSWIVVTADHGEELMEHGALLAHGRTLYEELLRVPLIIKLPRQRHAGSVVDEVVEAIDLMPTLLDGAGLYVPPGFQGTSLLPLIVGDRSATRATRQTFSELVKPDRYVQALRTQRYKYIRTYHFEPIKESSARDLSPGLSVRVKGKAIQNGPFMATSVSVKHGGGAGKLRGPVERIDPDARELAVLGVPISVEDEAAITDSDGARISLVDLQVGELVTVTLSPAHSGQWCATELAPKKPGGKLKVRGVIEQAEDLPGSVRRITVSGVNCLIGEQTAIRGLRETAGPPAERTSSALERVLSDDVVEVRPNCTTSRPIQERRATSSTIKQTWLRSWSKRWTRLPRACWPTTRQRRLWASRWTKKRWSSSAAWGISTNERRLTRLI